MPKKKRPSGATGRSDRPKLTKKELAQLWEDNKSERPQFGDVIKDGTYFARLALLEIQRKETDPVIVSDWVIVRAEEEKGKSKRVWHSLTDGDRITWTQDYLRKLGIDVDSIDFKELDGALTEALSAHPTARVQLYTPGETQYFRLLEIVDVADEDEDEDEDEVDSDEDEDDGSEDEDEEEEEDEDEEEEEDDEDEEEEDEEEEDEEPEVIWSVGDRVVVDYDGTDYEGVIKRVLAAKKQAIVEFEDGRDTVGFDEMQEATRKGKKTKKESKYPVIGDRVVHVAKDGSEREAEVVRVSKSAQTCTVLYDDTSKKKTVPWKELELLVQET